jgi:hypothetical protein
MTELPKVKQRYVDTERSRYSSKRSINNESPSLKHLSSLK